MKHKVIIKQVITTEFVVDAVSASEALEVGNRLLANDMIPESNYQMEEGTVEVEKINDPVSEITFNRVS